jgi:endo-alpha-1,4-polygalactosaminidase (GH114 family)
MGLSSYARQFVSDTVDVSDLKWSSLDVVVEELTRLQAEGYTGFDVDTYDDYGSTSVELKVTKQRLENDEEYEARMKQTEFLRKREYDHFLKLKAKFEDPTKPF